MGPQGLRKKRKTSPRTPPGVADAALDSAAMAPRTFNGLLAIALVLLVAGLGLLATLQYRWIDRVSDAERQRMRASADFAMQRLAEDLGREVESVFEAFARSDSPGVAAAFERWQRSASHPGLVAEVDLAVRGQSGWSLQRLDPLNGRLDAVSWPPELEPLRARFGLLEVAQPGRRFELPRPMIDGVPVLVIPQRADRSEGDGTPMNSAPLRGGPMDGGPRSMVIARLDRKELTSRVMPALVRRHFSAGEDGAFDVALLAGPRVLYQSDASFPGAGLVGDGELVMTPLGAPMVRPGPPPGMGGPGSFQRTRNAPAAEAWKIVVRRRDGGLEAIIRGTRRRNLAVSFGVLAILAAALITLIELLRRSARLNAQQTEFVAAMSHELNTPVAALRSAGENLRDGIVADPERVTRYGEAIVRDSTRLGEILGQIMEFAGMQARGTPTRLSEIDLGGVVDEAVAQCRWLAEAEGVELDVRLDPTLPPVNGDAPALTRAVQNLLANAIRHGRSGHWAGVSATSGDGRVSIRVEDRGPGIDRRDTGRLFEPFYRGVNTERTPGAGLGLTIVRRIVAAHGGAVRIERRDQGVAFIIDLPGAR